MKYVFCIFGEEKEETYKEQKMWLHTEGNKSRRVFPIQEMIDQTVFCVQTLRLFDKNTMVEIYTNKPELECFKQFNQFSNIKIINFKEFYEKRKKDKLWCYRLRFDVYKQLDDDFVSLECDMFFKAPPKFELTDNKYYTITLLNTGIMGLTKKTKDKIIDEIIEKFDDRIKNYTLRCLDQDIFWETWKKYNFEVIETKNFLHHYYGNKVFYKTVSLEKIKKDNGL